MQTRLSISMLVAMVLTIGCASTDATKNENVNAERPKSGASVVDASDDSARQAVVVGTIHKAHLSQPAYPLSTLKAVFDAYQPDLVLVEIRPEAFAKGHYEDGPFEMGYVSLLAARASVPVVGIDWFDDNAVGNAMSKADPKALAALEREATALSKDIPWPPSFAQAHASTTTKATHRLLNAFARHLGPHADWNERQAWFHHHAFEAIERHEAKRVLAFVGNQHRPELQQYLSAMGLATQSPLEILKGVPKAAPVDDEVVKMWQDGIERMKAKAKASGPPLKQALESKVAYFQTAVALKGACCANDNRSKALIGEGASDDKPSVQD